MPIYCISWPSSYCPIQYLQLYIYLYSTVLAVILGAWAMSAALRVIKINNLLRIKDERNWKS